MRTSKSQIAIIALLYLIAGVVNLWVGLSMVLLHSTLWIILRAIVGRQDRSSQAGADRTSDHLISAVREHQMYKVEGEIFGLTARLQEAVREAVKDLDAKEQRSTLPSIRVIPFVVIFLGLQTLATLTIVAQSAMRLDPWAILTVIIVPCITYQVTQEHFIDNKKGI